MKYFFVCLLTSLISILFNSCSYSQNLQIIKSANEAHYNLSTEGLKSFSSKIRVKEINEISKLLQDTNPNDPSSDSLKDYLIASYTKMHFIGALKNDGYCDLELSNSLNTGVEELDKNFERMINGIDDVICGYLGIWGSLTFQSIFSDMNLDYRISNQLNFYYFEFSQNHTEITGKLSKEGKLSEFTYKSPEDYSKITTNFINTEKGYLLKDYKILSSKDPFEIDVEIDYQQIDGFFLPQKVSILNKLKSGPVNSTLFFSDYKLEKLP